MRQVLFLTIGVIRSSFPSKAALKLRGNKAILIEISTLFDVRIVITISLSVLILSGHLDLIGFFDNDRELRLVLKEVGDALINLIERAGGSRSIKFFFICGQYDFIFIARW